MGSGSSRLALETRSAVAGEAEGVNDCRSLRECLPRLLNNDSANVLAICAHHTSITSLHFAIHWKHRMGDLEMQYSSLHDSKPHFVQPT